MIFPTRSIFIFGSWLYKADDKGTLHGHLVEAPEAHEDLTLLMKLTKDLEKLMVSEPTRDLTTINLDLTTKSGSFLESYPGSFKDKPSRFPIGL
jgi:pyridoxal biosynthesis lyase PdxS